MGLFSSPPDSGPLRPFDPPLGLDSVYCVPQETTLVLKEKAFSASGDTFSVKDLAGIDVVLSSGSAMSLRDRKGERGRLTGPSGEECLALKPVRLAEIKNSQGGLLFTLENKTFALLKTIYGRAPDGRELFKVEKQLSCGRLLFHLLLLNNRALKPHEWLIESPVGSKELMATFRNTAADGGSIELVLSVRSFRLAL